MLSNKQMAIFAARLLDEKKAQDIMLLDVHEMTVITDYMLICSGRSVPQVKALCEHVEEKLYEQGFDPRRKEGVGDGRWIVLDYGSLMIHIFHEQDRAYYQLERLWSDGANGVGFEEVRGEGQ